MNIIGKRKIWYAISILSILPGLFFLLTSGLKLGIDFTGGSLIEIEGQASEDKIREVAEELELSNVTINESGNNRRLIRYAGEKDPIKGEEQHQRFKSKLTELGVNEVRFDTVGPSVSRDIAKNAFWSVFAVSLTIVIYIAFAFRKSPPPVSPWSFGFAAISALLHDTLLLIGVFAILGHFLNVEVDALFVTAVLTVVGFSVHDTIVVFDRIRENLLRERKSFEVVVNDSILETMGRSVNTSVTVLLTLLALYLFGGESIKHFVLALLIGIASGTYSSIFNASPLLVTWHNYKLRQVKKV